MKFSGTSTSWIVIAAVFFFSLSNLASIIVMEVLSPKQKLFLGLIVVAYFILHWLAVIWISARLQKRYPDAGQDRIRLIKTYLYSAAIITLTMVAMSGIENLFLGALFWSSPYQFLFDFFQGLGFAILIVSLTEAFYQYQKNQQSERENAELTRVNLLAQYNNLKQQVNPHFLFNSLNSLSSLISIDPLRAEAFVVELSLVYRYLLQNSRDELVLLCKELSFLSSYIHLIKARFGEGLVVNIDIPKIWHYYQIPPLSLQLLVENAVKHNEVSPENPLRININIIKGNRIRVCNNLQEKAIALPSEKVGLVNIITKYRLLGQEEVTVLKTSTHFCITLPLIKCPSHEHSYS